MGSQMKGLIFCLTMVLIMSVSIGDVESGAAIYKGIASWYSEDDPGVLETTANMERFDDSEFTCAIWEVPFGTILKVTNTENNKYVYVRVNDRGPAKRLVMEGRVIDLTKKAFSRIADLEEGLVEVKIETM